MFDTVKYGKEYTKKLKYRVLNRNLACGFTVKSSMTQFRRANPKNLNGKLLKIICFKHF